jgi:hypothetical protein
MRIIFPNDGGVKIAQRGESNVHSWGYDISRNSVLIVALVCQNELLGFVEYAVPFL